MKLHYIVQYKSLQIKVSIIKEVKMLWTTIGLVTKCAIHKNKVVIYTFIIVIIIKLTVAPHNIVYISFVLVHC